MTWVVRWPSTEIPPRRCRCYSAPLQIDNQRPTVADELRHAYVQTG